MATTSGDVISADDFPLPTDFDTNDDAPMPGDFPSFTEINFDPPTAQTDASMPEPAPVQTPSNDVPPINTDIIARLPGARADGEFIIYKDNLIVVHSDPGFWIADDTDWFATGAQRPSPVTAVRTRATKLNLKPVLYLVSTNILDLDARIAEWESNGVRVITDLAALN